MQKAQAGERADQNEVERAQAHDGHDVGGVGEEGVAGDGEDGGDRVHGEDNVAELDSDEREQQEGGGGAAILADDEAVLARADGVQAGEPCEPAGRSGGLGLIFGDKKADSSYEEDCGEGVGDPGEVGEEGETSGDEEAAQENCAGYSPEEDFGLTGGSYLEEAEEEQEDEEIVDGEQLFDGVSGEVLHAGGGAKRVMDEGGEGEGGGDPEGSGGQRRAVGRAVEARLAAGVEKLGGEQKEEREVEADPVGDGRRGHITMLPHEAH